MDIKQYPDEIYTVSQPADEFNGWSGQWASQPINPDDQRYVRAEVAEQRLADAVTAAQNESRGITPAFLRPKDAAEYIGVSRRTVYELHEKDPDFPLKIELTPRVVGWRRESLDRWLAGKEETP